MVIPLMEFPRTGIKIQQTIKLCMLKNKDQFSCCCIGKEYHAQTFGTSRGICLFVLLLTSWLWLLQKGHNLLLSIHIILEYSSPFFKVIFFFISPQYVHQHFILCTVFFALLTNFTPTSCTFNKNYLMKIIVSHWSMTQSCGLSDIMTQLPGIVGPSLAVQQVVVVPCEEQQVMKVDGTATVVIPPPHSHIEPRPITCHLLSSKMHEGMVGGKVGQVCGCR